MIFLWFVIWVSLVECQTLGELYEIQGTHDSAAYQLGSSIQSRYDDRSALFWNSIRSVETLGIPLATVLTRWSRAQNLSIGRQLQNGAAYLDVRCGWNGSAWNSFHLEQGIPCFQVFAEIRQHLVDSATRRNPLLVEVGHLDASTPAAVMALCQEIVRTLGLWLKPKEYNGDHELKNVTELPLSGFQRKPLLLTVSTGETILREFPNIWPGQHVWQDSYANTPNLAAMITYNRRLLASWVPTGKLLKLAWTLTPSVSYVLCKVLMQRPPTSLLQLAATANEVFCKEKRAWAQQPHIVMFDGFSGRFRC